MQMLRLSTASQVIQIGPFVDSIDGATAETALSIANTDIKVRKAGGTTHTNKNSGGATHIASGYYHATLDATDSNTLGMLEVTVNMSGALPVVARFMVMAADAYDALFHASDGRIRANVSQWLGSAPNALASGRVDGSVGAMAANVVTATAIASNAITDAKINDGALTNAKFADGALTAAKFAAGAFDAVWSVATRILTAGTNIVLAKGTGLTGLNDLSAAQVNAEVDTALADYDGPTKAELDSAEAAILAAIEDALSDTARPAPTGPPDEDAPLTDKIAWLYAKERHKRTQADDGTEVLRNFDDDGTIGTRTNTDDGTTATLGGWS
jgi:hypothetical protein